MSARSTASPTLLPHAAPANPYDRLLLYGIRRMAVGGIADAHAAHAFFTGFGLGYRRPLVLLRALMAEMSRVASARVTVAPCCCLRMTGDEQALMLTIALAPTRPDHAQTILADLLKVRQVLGLITSAQAVNSAFADLGMPLDTNCV